MSYNNTISFIVFSLISLAIAESSSYRHLSVVPTVNDLFAQCKDLYIIYERYQEAIACFDEAIHLDPGYLPALLHKLNAITRFGDVEKAIRFFNTALHRYDNSASVYYIAVRLLAISNGTKATEWLEMGDKLIDNDNNVEEVLLRATALFALNRILEAFGEFDRAIALSPDYAPAYYDRATALLITHKFSEALVVYNKAIELNPRYAAAYSRRGWVLARLDRKSEGLRDYDKAEELGTTFAPTYYSKGVILSTLNRNLDAITSYDKSLSRDANYMFSYRDKANALQKLGRLEEAIECLDKAIALDPLAAEILRDKATALVGLNRPLEAIECCERSIKINPHDVTTLLNLGNALLLVERTSEAILAYETAIKIQPDYVRAHHNKAAAIRKMKDNSPNWKVLIKQDIQQDL